MSLAEDLKQIIKGEVREDEKTLVDFSTDASIFQIKPKVVVSPKDSEDIKALVKYASTHDGVTLTPRSAGTDMSGGVLTESVVLDFLTHFQGIINIDEEKMEATVLPGTFYRDLETELSKKDLLLPCYTASKTINTVGGMVGNNSGGEKTLKYGKTEKYVKQLKVVFADGNEYVVKPLNKAELYAKMVQNDFEGSVYKEMWRIISESPHLIKASKPNVSKNSAGYYLWNVCPPAPSEAEFIFDLTRIITGSQGTLGIVTEITFSLVRPKKHSTLLVVFLRDFKVLAELVTEILKFKPESFESYDDQTEKLAIRFMPELVKKMGSRGLISLALKFWPEALMTIEGGLPKLVMVAEFTGDSEEEVHKQARLAAANIKKYKVKTRLTKSDDEENKYWTVRRESFALLRSHIHGKHTAPFIDDVAVRPGDLPIFLPHLNEIMSHYKIIYTIAGHIGDGNFHIIPIMDYKDPKFVSTVKSLSKEVYELVTHFGGTITGEHNDGIIRTPFLFHMFPKEVLVLFRETKRAFDPKGIFNPGKKVPDPKTEMGTMDYIFGHLLKE